MTADQYASTPRRTFGVVDYILFVGIFAISTGIGLYHAIKDRKKNTAENFHFGGRKMSLIPVSLSLMASPLSAITLLGTPAEIYTYTTMYWWLCAGMLVATIGAAHAFMPVFYNLKCTSIYEYLELRFGKFTRTLTSVGCLLQGQLYISLILLGPAISLETITGLSFWVSVITVGGVGTLYTMLGGMKTVLWTDSFQLTIMVAGLLAVLIEGAKATGGFANAWDVADQSGRISFTDFNLDPRVRHSAWTLTFGGGLYWMYACGVMQMQVQRACSLPTLLKAKAALWINFVGFTVIVSLCCMIGIVVYAFYRDCDPVKSGKIDRMDQILPLFVMDILGDIPGLPGVFVACIFSSSLSTLSSGLNAASAMILEDVLKSFCCHKLSAKAETVISKVLVVIGGAITLALAITLAQLPGLILQFNYTFLAVFSGPLLGLFASGMLFPWTNKWGAIGGLLTSFAVLLWLGFGTILSGVRTPANPISVENCPKYLNLSVHHNCTTEPPMFSTEPSRSVFDGQDLDEPQLYEIYRLSYLWYTGLGIAVHITSALMISLVTGPTRPASVDPRLVVPIFDKVFPFLPECVLRPLRCGVRYNKKHEYTINSNYKTETIKAKYIDYNEMRTFLSQK